MRDAHHGNGPLATRQTRLTTVAVDIDALTAAASRGFLTSCSIASKFSRPRPSSTGSRSNRLNQERRKAEVKRAP